MFHGGKNTMVTQRSIRTRVICILFLLALFSAFLVPNAHGQSQDCSEDKEEQPIPGEGDAERAEEARETMYVAVSGIVLLMVWDIFKQEVLCRPTAMPHTIAFCGLLSLL
jgi:hypothetical protein